MIAFKKPQRKKFDAVRSGDLGDLSSNLQNGISLDLEIGVSKSP